MLFLLSKISQLTSFADHWLPWLPAARHFGTTEFFTPIEHIVSSESLMLLHWGFLFRVLRPSAFLSKASLSRALMVLLHLTLQIDLVRLQPPSKWSTNIMQQCDLHESHKDCMWLHGWTGYVSCMICNVGGISCSTMNSSLLNIQASTTIEMIYKHHATIWPTW